MKFWSGKQCVRFHFFPKPKKELTNIEFWNRVDRNSDQVGWLPVVISLLLIGLLVWMVVQCL